MRQLATAQCARIHVLGTLQQSLASEADFLTLLDDSSTQSHLKDFPSGLNSGHGYTITVSGGAWRAVAVRQDEL